jgi:hypothetical protein
MNRSIMWVVPENDSSDDRARLTRLRTAQFLPVSVHSIDTALYLLRQFQAGAVVVRTSLAVLEECTRLAETGSPVVALGTSADAALMDRYLRAGCAAVVVEPCPFKTLCTVLQRVTSGERQVRWPDTSIAQVG